MSNDYNPNLITKKFIPLKPEFDQVTQRNIYIFVTGHCLRYMCDGQQVSLTRGFGEVMKGIDTYIDDTFNKVMSYLRDRKALDSTFSDHQVTVAETAKRFFPPEGKPLLPGNSAQNEVADKTILHQRIRHAIDTVVRERYQKSVSHGDTWTSATVEFDMGAMEGPHAHQYPGFRVMLTCGKASYTHHYLIDEFNTREDLQTYANMMAGGNTSIVHVFGAADVASHESLVAMYEPTVIAAWRGLMAKLGK